MRQAMKYYLTILFLAINLYGCITVKCPCKEQPKDNGLQIGVIDDMPYRRIDDMPIQITPGWRMPDVVDTMKKFYPLNMIPADTTINTRVIPL